MRVNSYSSDQHSRDLTRTTPIETFSKDKIGQIIHNAPEEIFKCRLNEDGKNMRSLTLGSQKSTASLGGSDMHNMDSLRGDDRIGEVRLAQNAVETKKSDTLAYLRENPPTVTSVSIDAKMQHLSHSNSNDIFAGMSKQDALPVMSSKGNMLTEQTFFSNVPPVVPHSNIWSGGGPADESETRFYE